MVYCCDSCGKNFDSNARGIDTTGKIPKCPLCQSEMVKEISTTSNLDGGEGQPQTPFAFGKLKKSKYKKYGFKELTPESAYVLIATELINKAPLYEISYKDYKEDSTSTPGKKVNVAIKEINRLVYEVEKIIRHNLRLKKEMNVGGDKFWKQSRHRVHKMSERLNRISNYLKHLSA